MRVQNPPARSDWLFYHYKMLRAICQSSRSSFHGPLPAPLIPAARTLFSSA